MLLIERCFLYGDRAMGNGIVEIDGLAGPMGPACPPGLALAAQEIVVLGSLTDNLLNVLSQQIASLH